MTGREWLKCNIFKACGLQILLESEAPTEPSSAITLIDFENTARTFFPKTKIVFASLLLCGIMVQMNYEDIVFGMVMMAAAVMLVGIGISFIGTPVSLVHRLNGE